MSFFESRRDKIAVAGPDECWLWTGWKTYNGYGKVYARGKMRRTHREAYETVHGFGSADELVVRHKCDVRNCVNPAHLEIGTQGDNTRDRDERGRNVPARGEANGKSKLTASDVRLMRELYVPRHPEFGTRALARRFGVSQATSSKIILRQGWRHEP